MRPFWSRRLSRRSARALAAALALLGGYTDLARGGTTASAALLVIAYVILVPAALLEA